MDAGVGGGYCRSCGGTSGEYRSRVHYCTCLLVLKDGIKWSTEYERAQEDEKVLLYLHGGTFLVRFLFFVPRLHANICHRWGLHTRLTQQRLLPREYSIVLCLFPECYRSTTDSVPGLLWNPRTRSQPQSSTQSRRTSTLSARPDSCLKTSP